MAIRIPVQDSAPTVAFEDAVQFVFDALGEVPEFRSTRGRQIELHGTLALAVLAMMLCSTTDSYAATNLSPRQANAKVLDKLLRRHWMIENRNHYVRDNRWREDRATWRSGDSAFVMFLLPTSSLNLLRTASPLWTDRTPMMQRSIAAGHTLTAAPETLLQKPP